MIRFKDVVIDIYEVVYKKMESDNKMKHACQNVIKELDNLIGDFDEKDKNDIEKRIKKLKKGSDYSWISTLSALASVTVLYKLSLYDSNIMIVLGRVLLVLIGLIIAIWDWVCDRSNKEERIFKIVQCVPDAALFISLLVGASVL